MSINTEFLNSIVIITVIVVGRVLSHFEHKKTNKMLNGELEKRIDKAVQEALNKK